MKIKKANEKVYFGDLTLGSVFKVNEKIFIRVEQSEGEYGTINAINLENGDGTEVNSNEKVEFYPNAELTL